MGAAEVGVGEYVNIVHAIGEYIDAAGGKASTSALIEELRARYPDITESSIRSYLGTLVFVLEKGVARRRTKADGWPTLPRLNTVRGVFRNGPNEIRVAQLVTSEVLRGSGQTVHPVVADAAGVSRPAANIHRHTRTGHPVVATGIDNWCQHRLAPHPRLGSRRYCR